MDRNDMNLITVTQIQTIISLDIDKAQEVLNIK